MTPTPRFQKPPVRGAQRSAARGSRCRLADGGATHVAGAVATGAVSRRWRWLTVSSSHASGFAPVLSTPKPAFPAGREARRGELCPGRVPWAWRTGSQHGAAPQAPALSSSAGVRPPGHSAPRLLPLPPRRLLNAVHPPPTRRRTQLVKRADEHPGGNAHASSDGQNRRGARRQRRLGDKKRAGFA